MLTDRNAVSSISVLTDNHNPGGPSYFRFDSYIKSKAGFKNSY